MRDRRSIEDVEAILESGFENAKLYDNDEMYFYYDAYRYNEKVEIRTTKDMIEWRRLNKSTMDVEWFLITENKKELLKQNA